MCVRDGVFVGPCSNDWINHDLAIVGYVGKGNDQDKYWIAKNSWGEDWGQRGYVWLKKDVADSKGICGIVATKPSYPVVSS
jgi:KDEL-tailed cysteine endopeptidase